MRITLIYNPQAGAASFSLEGFVKGLEASGAEVLVHDIKEDNYEHALDHSCDFIIIAGGDGTIEKIAEKAINLDKNVPFAILPCGNANNIAGSLDVDTAIRSIVESWQQQAFRNFTVGVIRRSYKNLTFFESVGWGLFAEVLQEVKEEKKAAKQPAIANQDKVKYGLQKLIQAVQELQPAFYQILVDGKDFSGYYLWVEVMNSRSMGPQLQLAPDAKHGDRYLDVVLIKEKERDQLEKFLVTHKGENHGDTFSPIKARHISIRSNQV